jgi:hypothetical protein
MSDLSPKSGPKPTLLRPHSPIAIYEYNGLVLNHHKRADHEQRIN